MSRWIGLSLALFIGILLSSNVCFAGTQKIKYSIGPKCDDNGNVVCGENEEAVCLVFSSTTNDPEEDIKYIPSCDREPKCVVKNSDIPAPDDVKLDCVEFAQCQDDVAHCSDGKIAKCLGNNNECECSEQICDYTWEISTVGSNDLH